VLLDGVKKTILSYPIDTHATLVRRDFLTSASTQIGQIKQRWPQRPIRKRVEKYGSTYTGFLRFHFTTEAAYGVGLLLFWPAALQVLRSVFATPGFPVLPVTADPSSCPFVPIFRRDIPGRSVFQAPMHISLRILHQFQITWGPKPFIFLRPCDPVVERSFPVFVDLLNTRDWSGTRFPSFRLRLS
jgi:hypothetical protein